MGGVLEDGNGSQEEGSLRFAGITRKVMQSTMVLPGNVRIAHGIHMQEIIHEGYARKSLTS